MRIGRFAGSRRFREMLSHPALPLHVMVLPGLALLFVFSYLPMVGIVIAFQDYLPSKGFFGSPWIGLDPYRVIFDIPDTWKVIRNTVVISVLKLFFGLITPVVTALLLNEIRIRWFKRSIQTLVFFPHFLSWVILGGIIIDVFSQNGAVNKLLGWFNLGPYFFMGDPALFRFVVVATDVWKDFGFSMIVFLAALTSIDPSLYESAMMDGANRWRQTLHITLPGIMPIVTLVAILNLGNILNAGFDQIFNLYNALVYETADIIDTYVYRIGLVNAQYGLATAMGLFKSAVGFVLIVISYYLAYRVANYRIF